MSEKKITLPLLKSIVHKVSHHPQFNLSNIAFVCVQHLLETNVELLSALIKLGARPENIFLLGKRYSHSFYAMQKFMKLGVAIHNSMPPFEIGNFSNTFKDEISDLWTHVLIELESRKTIESVVIIDDGGYCLTTIPESIMKRYPVIGIEQTTAGIFKPGMASVACPIIQVATSAAKRILESPIIATAVAKKLDHYLPKLSKKARCGVIGMGAIGQAVTSKLRSIGYSVMAYDNDLYKLQQASTNTANSVAELIRNCDIIIGCSGRDTLDQECIDSVINGNKIFLSCSSEDKEFLSLLRWIRTQNQDYHLLDPLRDIMHRTRQSHLIHILRGGFPINFDNNREVEPERDIQLTRALILCGILQSVIYLRSSETKNFARYMLQPEIQRYIALTWRKVYPFPLNSIHINQFYDMKWISTQSGGGLLESNILTETFSYTEDHKLRIFETRM